MKKLCVFSDSHGCAEHMLRVLGRERPDLVIHLGDGETDLIPVRNRYPDLPIENVRGNCDRFSTALNVLRATVDGVRIFAVHGHMYDVKLDPAFTRLRYAALEDDAKLLLFGHTHSPLRDRVWGMEILNPGSCGDIPCPTYGLVLLNGGTVTTEVREAL